MRRRFLALLVAGCLMVTLACSGGAWGLYRGQIQPPTGVARLGPLEVMAITSAGLFPS
jgi:hypothetical protein